MSPETVIALVETDQVTSRVEVTDILSGDPPAILTLERAANMKSGARDFTQKVAVRDPALFHRLLAEVNKGDKISATVVTEWYEDDYSTYLADFSILSPDLAPTARPLAAAP